MASKKSVPAEEVKPSNDEPNAEAAENLEQQGPEAEQPEPPAENPETGENPPEPDGEPPEADDEPPEPVTLVYIGPSIPYGKLRSSMVLRGTEKEIRDFLEEYREPYPEAAHLLVTPDRLTGALDKVARKGTILHKYYEDMLAKTRASRIG